MNTQQWAKKNPGEAEMKSIFSLFFSNVFTKESRVRGLRGVGLPSDCATSGSPFLCLSNLDQITLYASISSFISRMIIAPASQGC